MTQQIVEKQQEKQSQALKEIEKQEKQERQEKEMEKKEKQAIKESLQAAMISQPEIPEPSKKEEETLKVEGTF